MALLYQFFKEIMPESAKLISLITNEFKNLICEFFPSRSLDADITSKLLHFSRKVVRSYFIRFYFIRSVFSFWALPVSFSEALLSGHHSPFLQCLRPL